MHDDPSESPKPGEDPCKKLRAKKMTELDKRWSSAIANIRYTCEYDGDGAGVHTVAIAPLRENAATMFGVPVTEVRLDVADFGQSLEYVLAGSLAARGKSLVAAIEARCRAQGFKDLDCKSESYKEDNGSTGYNLYFGEITNVWLHQDPDNPQRIVYAESSGD